MRELYKKYKSFVLYIVFGVATTLVNIVVYYVCAHIMKLATIPSNIVAWLLSVLFAYVTNRIWVFESGVRNLKGILFEILSFFGCRLLTGIMDVVLMYLTVDRLQLDDLVMKCVVNVIVIIVNYVASKLVVFRKK